MNLGDLFEIVRGDLERNRRRTLLTMLGLVIGSAAVVTVTSIGLAGRAYVVEQLETLGSNLIYAWYDGPTPSPDDLTEEDYREVKEHSSALSLVSRLAVTSEILNVRGEDYDIAIVGTDGLYAQVRNIVLREGRFIGDADVSSRRKVCVLSRSLAAALFGAGPAVGQRIRLQSLDFDIVGVFRDAQSFSIPTELSQNSVIMPISVLETLTNTNRIDRIYAQARGRELVDRATKQLADILARNHGSNVTYRVGNLGEVLNVIHRVSRSLILVVAVVSAISLLVGGVGIMNIMLVTVRERTPEIGIRKALGARPRHILDAFLMEACLISIVGGAAGILIGCTLPVLLGTFFDVTIPISAASILFAFAVSAGIGILFGYYPAKRASRLDPVQSLRYE